MSRPRAGRDEASAGGVRVCTYHGTPCPTRLFPVSLRLPPSPGRRLRRLRRRAARTLTGHPALDIPLLATGHGQRTGRHVLRDHRPGGGVRTVPDRDRSHKHVVRTRPAVRPDRRVMLVLSVVVHEHARRTDVRSTHRSSRHPHTTDAEPSSPHRSRRSSSPRTYRSCPSRPAAYPDADTRTAPPTRPRPTSAPSATVLSTRAPAPTPVSFSRRVRTDLRALAQMRRARAAAYPDAPPRPARTSP